MEYLRGETLLPMPIALPTCVTPPGLFGDRNPGSKPLRGK